MRKTLTSLKTAIRSVFSTVSVKRIVIGKNDEPIVADLPQIQIWPSSTEIELSGTAKDEQTRTVFIRAIVSVPKNMGQTQSQTETVSSVLDLIDIMEKQTSVSDKLSTASILGVLRNDPTVSGNALYVNDMVVDYGELEDLEYPNAKAETSCVFRRRTEIK